MDILIALVMFGIGHGTSAVADTRPRQDRRRGPKRWKGGATYL
jgi:hypothetical protein